MHIVKNYSVIGICLLRFLDDPFRVGADLVEDPVKRAGTASSRFGREFSDWGLTKCSGGNILPAKKRLK